MESLAGALRRFDEIAGRFQPERIRRHALRFNRQRFKDRVREHLDERYERFREALGTP